MYIYGFIYRVISIYIHIIYHFTVANRPPQGVTYSERIGHALLPLHKLASGLMPAGEPNGQRRGSQKWGKGWKRARSVI